MRAKRLLMVTVVLWMWGLALAAEDPPPAAVLATTPKAEHARWLNAPKQMLRGYTQFDLAAPHNEIDPNLCSADPAKMGGSTGLCTAFGRYMLSGYVEFHPFAAGPLRKAFAFGEPRFLFGRNMPQTLYTWSMAPIGWERSWGLGWELPKRFEVRFTQHFLFSRLGARDRNLGPADLGPNGPWGRYNVVGVRKYFGNWGPAQ